MSKAAELVINIDGAARGNPGPAAYAYLIARGDEPPIEEAACMGEATNNVAEYTALVRALERALSLDAKSVLIRSDSELLVKQMTGIYRVKNEQLKQLFDEAKELARRIPSLRITHVRREQNSDADRLCNEVLDGERGGMEIRKLSFTSRVSPTEDPKTNPSVSVRVEGIQLLSQIEKAWSRNDGTAPSPVEVWDRIWGMLEDRGLLKPP